MSDTPRTDAETMRDEYDHVDTEFGAFAPSDTVSADFARHLERELAEVTKQRDGAFALIEYAGELLGVAPQEHKSAHGFKVLQTIKDLVEANRQLEAVKGGPSE